MLGLVLLAVTGRAGAEDQVERPDCRCRLTDRSPAVKGPLNTGKERWVRRWVGYLGEVQMPGSEGWREPAVPPTLKEPGHRVGPRQIRQHNMLSPRSSEHSLGIRLRTESLKFSDLERCQDRNPDLFLKQKTKQNMGSK